MDNSKIVVTMDLFSMIQQINVISNGSTACYPCSLNDLDEQVVDICHENNIYKVFLTGAPISFQNTVAERIYSNELTHFSENKINIEVI